MDITHGLDPAPLATLRDAVGASGTADAARVLAGHLPVFPCVPGSARPLPGAGPRAASVDPDRVAWWWSRYPSTNLAIPTGAGSGLDALDVRPGPGDRSGFGTVRQAMDAGLLPGPGLMIATPSGGLRLFFPCSPDTEQRSWTTPLGVRFNGDGGYVLLPPSLVQRSDGTVARYRTVGSGRTDTAPVDATRLQRFLDPHQVRLLPSTSGPVNPRVTTARRATCGATPVPVTSSASTAPDARLLSRPYPGGPDRRPPEVVSL